MQIDPTSSIRGEIPLPGDKSISHRAAIFAALADGTTRITNFSASADCAATLECLKRLGIEIDRNGSSVTVTGVGKTGFSRPESDLDCENSGTTMRLLSGVLAGQDFRSVLTGDESLRRRPMKRVIEPLSKMGAAVEADDGHAPLVIQGSNPLKAIEYETPVASAQIKSCVLLAGLNADGETALVEKTPTRDHTERMLRWFGADVREESVNGALRKSIKGDTNLTARDLSVPGDISAAAFFIVAAACLGNSEIVLPNVGLNPTRTGVLEVLRGCRVEIGVRDAGNSAGEPVGTIVAGTRSGKPAPGFDVLNGAVIANLIDEIPILAVFGTQLENGLEFRDASELRVKETDRIAAVVENLKRMNAKVEEFPDGFRVERSDLKGAAVEAFGDHRIAMAFAVAALLADGPTQINGAGCVDVSFPDFFDVLRSVAA